MLQKEIQIGEHKLFYRTAGVGSKTILLLHGIPTNSFLWMNVIPQLAKQYTVIAPDMLGYGLSGRAAKEELTLPMQAQYIYRC
ncbi:alpha/beta fold hydrolase [Bacillus vallismortis]|uniref:alpha/beta fold hydrolase n=1 Tax=Bacillus vallismortis TaxID=72361 RepID=UPI002DBDC085|nr:alpha/beta fold hydrolase [Bacillus vallismortis]MEC1652582.1 alpha/beta fold hydrolase [Bacillus vallismortis]